MSTRSGLVAGIPGVLALVAVAITVPVGYTAWHRPGPDPAAPGLAALGDEQLLGLLPAPSDFPAGWSVGDKKGLFEGLFDDFGYYYDAAPVPSGFTIMPQECQGLNTVLSTGGFNAAEVSGYRPGAPQSPAGHPRIRLMVGREFNPAGFAAMTARVSRCPSWVLQIRPGDRIGYRVQILENSSPAGGPQRFRYALTTTPDEDEPGGPYTEYFSYARASGLVLSGSGTAVHQQEFDGLCEDTLSRLRVG